MVAAALEAEAALTSDDKKRRALMKKLTAIDQLKAKKAAGEKLELTQHKKLDRCVLLAFLAWDEADAFVCAQRGRDSEGVEGAREVELEGTEPKRIPLSSLSAFMNARNYRTCLPSFPRSLSSLLRDAREKHCFSLSLPASIIPPALFALLPQ